MRQFYFQRERANDYTIRVTSESGSSNEIVGTVTSKRAAIAEVDRRNKAALAAELASPTK